jgi:hypothetical protein
MTWEFAHFNMTSATGCELTLRLIGYIPDQPNEKRFAIPCSFPAYNRVLLRLDRSLMDECRGSSTEAI